MAYKYKAVLWRILFIYYIQHVFGASLNNEKHFNMEEIPVDDFERSPNIWGDQRISPRSESRSAIFPEETAISKASESQILYKPGRSDSRYIIPSSERKKPVYSSKTYFGEPKHGIPRKYWSPRRLRAGYFLNPNQTYRLRSSEDSNPFNLKMNVDGFRINVKSASKRFEKHPSEKSNFPESQGGHVIEISPIETIEKAESVHTASDKAVIPLSDSLSINEGEFIHKTENINDPDILNDGVVQPESLLHDEREFIRETDQSSEKESMKHSVKFNDPFENQLSEFILPGNSQDENMHAGHQNTEDLGHDTGNVGHQIQEENEDLVENESEIEEFNEETDTDGNETDALNEETDTDENESEIDALSEETDTEENESEISALSEDLNTDENGFETNALNEEIDTDESGSEISVLNENLDTEENDSETNALIEKIDTGEKESEVSALNEDLDMNENESEINALNEDLDTNENESEISGLIDDSDTHGNEFENSALNEDPDKNENESEINTLSEKIDTDNSESKNVFEIDDSNEQVEEIVPEINTLNEDTGIKEEIDVLNDDTNTKENEPEISALIEDSEVEEKDSEINEFKDSEVDENISDNNHNVFNEDSDDDLEDSDINALIDGTDEESGKDDSIDGFTDTEENDTDMNEFSDESMNQETDNEGDLEEHEPVKEEIEANIDTFDEGSGDSGDQRSFQNDAVTSIIHERRIGTINENLPASEVKDTTPESPAMAEMFFRSNDSSTACKTPSGDPGHCRSMTQCILSDALNNFSLFLQYLCLSRGPLVGVCCPDNPVLEDVDSVDNSTEAAPREFKQPKGGCGQLSSNSRIVGGTMSTPHEWTWMVALMRRNRFFCGGVIINDWYVLTAAHCVMGIRVKDLSIRLGEYNFNEKNEHQKDIPVAEIKRHARFVTLTFEHDIALLKLKRQVEFSKFVGSICLPDSNDQDYAEVNATVVGWGTVSFGGAASPVLRQVTIPVWSNEECDKTYLLESITDAFMCAGSPETGEDACQGDSGGPLMALNDKKRWEVIGIVSWGRRCGDPTYPGVYTRVTTYLDWINDNIK